MREITWKQAIRIAKRREECNNIVGPLSVLCNGGAKGDFMSLKSTGIVGTLANDGEKWFVDTGAARVYLTDFDTVWIG